MQDENNRVNAVENQLGLILGTLGSLKERMESYENKRPCNDSTQTAIIVSTERECQTEFRKNVTERGNQIQPVVGEQGTQTDPQPNVGKKLMEKMSQVILPALASVKMEWLKEAIEENVVKDGAAKNALQNIITKRFSTDDVVVALHACIEIVRATYAEEANETEESGTEYESEYDTGESESDVSSSPGPEQPQPRAPGVSLYYKVRNGL